MLIYQGEYGLQSKNQLYEWTPRKISHKLGSNFSPFGVNLLPKTKISVEINNFRNDFEIQSTIQLHHWIPWKISQKIGSNFTPIGASMPPNLNLKVCEN